jgi:anti-sigma-K factor RskA
MNHEVWLAQAEIYALGALDSDELTAFETHLAAGCPVCERHILTTREALTLLPHALTSVAPPSHVRERLLEQIATEAARPQPAMHLPRRWWMMAASVLAAAGLLLALSYRFYQTRQELQHAQGVASALRAELQQREADLQAERRELLRATELVATLQAELAKREETLEAERRDLQRLVATLQSEREERDETLRLLSTPQVRLVQLAGLAASPSASAQLLWNPAGQTGLLLTSGLPQIPRDKVYELWAIAGKEPAPAGLFEVDGAGRAFLRLPPLPRGKRFTKFAVTLEPAGGVPKPTGPTHLLGSL